MPLKSIGQLVLTQIEICLASSGSTSSARKLTISDIVYPSSVSIVRTFISLEVLKMRIGNTVCDLLLSPAIYSLRDKGTRRFRAAV
ncbi:unnamed protein product [Dracunculus medinensis]|uniref:Secreted protein n=1 Tax=Dracunculus medinensis TaxID=318479 RepID=A0A0N4UF17_DRAME|nr:unnamed protein product [Dracunculus medinensis]